MCGSPLTHPDERRSTLCVPLIHTLNIFVIILSRVSCSVFLFLKNWTITGPVFLVLMSLITYFVQRSVANTFVVNSLNLPINLARVVDEEEVKIKCQDWPLNFVYFLA